MNFKELVQMREDLMKTYITSKPFSDKWELSRKALNEVEELMCEMNCIESRKYFEEMEIEINGLMKTVFKKKL